MYFRFLYLAMFCIVSIGCLNKGKNESQSSKLMVADIMHQRFTARTFKKDKVKPEHMTKILEAGLLVPSKDKLFPYEIIVLTDSEKGKEFHKTLWGEYMTYEQCDGEGNKIRQYINSVRTAPVNILFVLNPKYEHGVGSPSRPKESEQVNFLKTTKRAARDAMISSTAMMIQAEQLGYDTAFSASIYHTYKNPKIELPKGA